MPLDLEPIFYLKARDWRVIGRIRVVGYFEVQNKSTHTRNAINAAPDTMTRNAKVPIAMPIQ
jgi:hypothetical protein